MSTTIFSRLNGNALGPGLVLEQGGMVVRTSLVNSSINRKVLGTLPIGSTAGSYFECQFFTGTRPASMPVDCRVGVAIANSTLTTGAGQDAGSYAYEPANGNIYNNGSAILGTAYPTGERTVIGVYLAVNPSVATVSFIIDGSYARTISLPTANFWVPCITVSGGEAGDRAAYINCGQVGFNYPSVTAGV